MEKIVLGDNKIYIIKENNKISTIRILEHSKNDLFVKIEDTESNKTKWRDINDFGSNIEILDESKQEIKEITEEVKPIEHPQQIDQSLNLIQNPIIQPTIPTTLNPYAYNTAKTREIISNMENLISKLKQSVK